MTDIVNDDFEPSRELPTGRLDLPEDEPSSWDGVRAVLWLPDPEQRHFWREFYVRDKSPAKPGRKIGF